MHGNALSMTDSRRINPHGIVGHCSGLIYEGTSNYASLLPPSGSQREPFSALTANALPTITPFTTAADAFSIYFRGTTRA